MGIRAFQFWDERIPLSETLDNHHPIFCYRCSATQKSDLSYSHAILRIATYRNNVVRLTPHLMKSLRWEENCSPLHRSAMQEINGAALDAS